MLTEDENRTLTEVGAGKPMGELLRRYWQPIAAVAELDEQPTKRVQLLGERLVLFKDGGGRYGLIDAFCAHMGTDLSFGIVEDSGLRCPRHGWLYDSGGQCVDQPLEDPPFAYEIKLSGYPVEAKAGLLWAYLGPLPAPLVPDWEPFGWTDGVIQIVFTTLTCSWLQCQENSLDPVEAEWLAGGPPAYAAGAAGPEPRLEFGFDEFDHGFVYRCAVKGAPAGEDDWRVGRTSLWPNGLFTGDDRSCSFEWRVPMDDVRTLSVAWFCDRAAPGAKLRQRRRLFHWQAPTRDEDGELIRSHSLNRKFAIWLTQDPIVDRTREFLVETDRGVVMLRDKLFSQIALLGDGGEPKGVLRDAATNLSLPLPKSASAAGTPPIEDEVAAEARLSFVAGQPADAAAAYARVRATWESDPEPAQRPRRPRRPRGAPKAAP